MSVPTSRITYEGYRAICMQVAVWRERCEVMARMEEATYAENVLLRKQLRAHGLVPDELEPCDGPVFSLTDQWEPKRIVTFDSHGPEVA